MATSATFNPFPGLRPFDTSLSHLFFGREQQVEWLLDLLRRQHFLTVLGPSGSGKSSLVRGGVVREGLYQRSHATERRFR